MDFGSLIAAVSSGKVDMVISSIYITEERKNRFIFPIRIMRWPPRFSLRKNIAAYGAEPSAVTGSPSFIARVEQQFYKQHHSGKSVSPDLGRTEDHLGHFHICVDPGNAARCADLLYADVKEGGSQSACQDLYQRYPRERRYWFADADFYVVFASVNISPVLVAIISLGMNFGAYASEIFRSGMEGVGKGQVEAEYRHGFQQVQDVLYRSSPGRAAYSTSI